MPRRRRYIEDDEPEDSNRDLVAHLVFGCVIPGAVVGAAIAVLVILFLQQR